LALQLQCRPAVLEAFVLIEIARVSALDLEQGPIMRLGQIRMNFPRAPCLHLNGSADKKVTRCVANLRKAR
jgi:hypothetical protein